MRPVYVLNRGKYYVLPILRGMLLACMAFVGIYYVTDTLEESAKLTGKLSKVQVESKLSVPLLQLQTPMSGSTRTPQMATQHLEPVVPNIVHVVWFYPEKTKFRFHHLLCLISVMKHIHPTKILFWYDHLPVGPWWVFVKQTVPHILMVEATPPRIIFGNVIERPEHQADVFRLNILLEYGGIYIDLDVIVLKAFDSLMTYRVTMGAESPDLLANGIILATKNASFLQLWRDTYRTFDDSQWNQHSVIIPMKLAKRHPDLVHIDWFSLLRPNWNERDWLYSDGKLWDWSENLAVHLYYREHNVDYDPNTIRSLNTTVGEIFRFIYYGNSQVLLPAL